MGEMEKKPTALERVDMVFVKLSDWSIYISVVCLLVAAFLSFANIVSSKVFGKSITNTTELVQYLLVPITYCAACKVQMDGGLMHVDLISRLLPKWLQNVIGNLGAVLGTVMYAFAAYTGISLLVNNYTLHKKAAMQLGSFEIWPFVLVYVVFSALLAITLAWSLVRAMILDVKPKSIADDDYDGGGIVL